MITYQSSERPHETLTAHEDETAAAETLAAVRAAANPGAPFPQQAAWARQFRRIRPDLLNLKPLRIAMLGNGTLGHFSETLRLWLALEGFDADLYLSPYGGFRQDILDTGSPLYAFHPDVVWLFATGRDAEFAGVRYDSGIRECETAVENTVTEWRTLWRQLRMMIASPILQNNFEGPIVRVFGEYDGAVPWSHANLVRRLNLALAEASAQENVSLFDLEHTAAEVGLRRWHEERHWHQSKQPFSPDAFGSVAFKAARFLSALRGNVKKCVVVDLDNTLWGGIIGDDGLAGIRLGDGPEGEAFVAFQEYLKKLVSRGILLAVCSKNEEATAKEPFLKHPAMRLGLDDIVVFRANWRSKVENLREIAATLNIGMDALVFLDDNPAERALVRSLLPYVTVPEQPEDPSDLVGSLAAGHYFEVASFSQEDASRTRLYYENAQREAALSVASDLNTFLHDLQMEGDSGPPDSFTLRRMVQLLARTNQFHPTTTRHGDAELKAFAADPRAWVRWFSLRDRFGDHGLVSVVVLLPRSEALVIDSWAMSCRVFSRGLEDFMLWEMVQAARRLGFPRLIGYYAPTKKNRPVADLYERLGFVFAGEENAGTRWVLDTAAYEPKSSGFIRPRRTAVSN
jgi:FkbH-like protein